MIEQYYRFNRLNLPHILVSLYNETNQTVTNDVRNDEKGEYGCHGNVSWFRHDERLSNAKHCYCCVASVLFLLYLMSNFSTIYPWLARSMYLLKRLNNDGSLFLWLLMYIIVNAGGSWPNFGDLKNSRRFTKRRLNHKIRQQICISAYWCRCHYVYLLKEEIINFHNTFQLHTVTWQPSCCVGE